MSNSAKSDTKLTFLSPEGVILTTESCDLLIHTRPFLLCCSQSVFVYVRVCVGGWVVCVCTRGWVGVCICSYAADPSWDRERHKHTQAHRHPLCVSVLQGAPVNEHRCEQISEQSSVLLSSLGQLACCSQTFLQSSPSGHEHGKMFTCSIRPDDRRASDMCNCSKRNWWFSSLLSDNWKLQLRPGWMYKNCTKRWLNQLLLLSGGRKKLNVTLTKSQILRHKSTDVLKSTDAYHFGVKRLVLLILWLEYLSCKLHC